eukprot:4172994-Prymnesium_polylepis.1
MGAGAVAVDRPPAGRALLRLPHGRPRRLDQAGWLHHLEVSEQDRHGFGAPFVPQCRPAEGEWVVML